MKIAWIILGTALVAGGVYLYRLSDASDQLVPVITGRIHKLGATGLTVAVEGVIKNPSNAKVEFLHPFVKLLYKGNTLGSSQVEGATITIEKYSQSRIDPAIMIEIPYSALILNAWGVYQQIKAGEPIQVEAYIKSFASVLGVSKKYEQTIKINISPKLAG